MRSTSSRASGYTIPLAKAGTMVIGAAVGIQALFLVMGLLPRTFRDWMTQEGVALGGAEIPYAAAAWLASAAIGAFAASALWNLYRRRRAGQSHTGPR